MGFNDRLAIGIVGSVGRGKSFKVGLEENGCCIKAVCDIQVDRLEESRISLGAVQAYSDYAEMLDRANLDAVIICTPMHLHAEQAKMALEKNIHVLSDVVPCVSLDEAAMLVKTCARSKAAYMIGENFCYMKHLMLVKNLVEKGLFGQIYFAEGEYLHELKWLNERTPWRRKWQTGINGITYGTHSLGPILQWMPDDRIVKVCCQNTGSHYKDARGEYYAQDTAIMLGKTAKGAIIKIRVDMVSDRPDAMDNYQLQGTDGSFESSRENGLRHSKLWLRHFCKKPAEWMDCETLMELDAFKDYIPQVWCDVSDAQLQAGHGGGDYLIVRDFACVVRGEIKNPLDIHRAMDMQIPCLVSQESVLADGVWLDVPDSRLFSC